MSKTWTTPADLRARVRKRWDRGDLLAMLVPHPPSHPPSEQPSEQDAAEPLFPWRLPLRGPSSAELSSRFDDARAWIAALRTTAHVRLEVREIHHRLLGANQVPTAAWIDTLDEALALIGKASQTKRFLELVALTRQRQPAMLPWLSRRPLQALELTADFSALLTIVDWMRQHPRPGIFLRQVDIPGVHSKFIEKHRRVLTEWFDLTLPEADIDANSRGAAGFERRYGFRDKPLRIRFRILDPARAALPRTGIADITLDAASFAQLEPPVSHVFITENEVNFLAFPPLTDALVIFGSGYGFEQLRDIGWLSNRRLYYWGDIDTHGFAILNQLRDLFADVHSFLMDRDTLLAFRPLWGIEPEQSTRDLPRLKPSEAALYHDLRSNRIRPGLRLEQERIGFGWVRSRLQALGTLIGNYPPPPR